MEASAWLKNGMLVWLMILILGPMGQNIKVGGQVENFGADATGHSKAVNPDTKLHINVWHGLSQKVGHLGYAQSDFNLVGSVSGFEDLAALTYSLNGAAPVELNIGRGKFGDEHRLAAPGDFNADIPVSLLRDGRNTIVVYAEGAKDQKTSVTAYVEKRKGTYPLPMHIDWDKVRDPQDVGQFVDGKWAIENGGLRTLRTGYDRVFLIGDTTWQDYEVTVPFTVHRVDSQTGPVSGGNGLGILMRFTGHVNGGPRNFPTGQPKWGYQPFGCLAFLRWKKNEPDGDPYKQFYRGDKDHTQNYGTMPIIPGKVYQMKMRCVTLPDEGREGVTRYSWKIWRNGENEQSGWDWVVEQKSEHALRKGGVVLLAHHVDVTFGDVRVEEIGDR